MSGARSHARGKNMYADECVVGRAVHVRQRKLKCALQTAHALVSHALRSSRREQTRECRHPARIPAGGARQKLVKAVEGRKACIH